MTDQDAVLRQWVVYDNPSDHPGKFVAREWLIYPASEGGARPSEVTCYVDEYLENVRRFIQAVAPDSFRIARSPEDDPVIVEVWT